MNIQRRGANLVRYMVEISTSNAMTGREHPSDRTLARYSLEELGRTNHRVVDEHVESCRECQMVCDGLQMALEATYGPRSQ